LTGTRIPFKTLCRPAPAFFMHAGRLRLQHRTHLGYTPPMRWLLRLILFWTIMTPISYYYGIPYALQMLTTKVQAQAYEQCQTQLTQQGLTGGLNSPLNAQQGVGYCHCMSDQLVVTKPDLWDMVQKKEPAALNTLAQAEADRCGKELQRMLGYLPPEPAATAPVDDTMIHL